MISVVVPAYNEESSIEKTIKSLTDIAAKSDQVGFEIIVVDDGSTDLTADRAESAGVSVIRKPQNIGYGHSLKIGIKAAKYDTIVIIDADGTYPISRVPDLVECYEAGFDMVVGQRTGKHYRESAIKFPLRLLFKWLVEFTVGTSVPDVNSGLRVFSKTEIMQLFPSLSDSFSFTTSSTLAYIMRNKYIKYIPIEYYERVGKSKVRLLRDSLRALQFIVQAIVYYNPIKIFLVLSVFVFFISVVLIGAAAWFGSLMLGALGGFSGLMAILIFALGLLAEKLKFLNHGAYSHD